MSDERQKLVGLTAPSPTSSDSSRQEQSLEHVFLGMTRALDGLTTAIEAATSSSKASSSDSADVKVALGLLVQSHAKLVEALIGSPDKPGSSGTMDEVKKMIARAERAVEDSKQIVTQAKGPEDEITGEHIKLRWKTIGQGLVYGAPIAFKILGVLTAAAVTAWGIVKNLFPFIKGLH